MALMEKYKAILRFRYSMLVASFTAMPMAGAAEDNGESEGAESTSEDKSEDTKDDAAESSESKESDDDKDDKGSTKDYRKELRRYERSSKRAAAAKDKKLADLEKELTDLKSSTDSETDKTIDSAVKKVEENLKQEYEGKLRHERLQATIARKAASKFKDVEDAALFLNLDLDLVFDGDDIQEDVIEDELEKLLERKSYLKATGARPTGSSDAGKGTGTKTLDEKIREAEKSGNLTESIALKGQKVLQLKDN